MTPSLLHQSNLLRIRLRSTVPGFVEIRHRGAIAPGPACRPRDSGTRVRDGGNHVERGSPVCGELHADHGGHFAMKLVDARVGMRPAVCQGPRIEPTDT